MPTSTVTLTDGTSVTIDCTASAPDPSLPIVVLLHGMGGTSLDMTAPAAAYPGLSFNRRATFPLYKDEGIQFVPPLLPAARFYLDPPAGPLTSWNAALKAAGFTTITYTENGPLITNDVTQLTLLVSQGFLRPVPSPGSLCRASAWRLSRTAGEDWSHDLS